jgi:hypothetical protein
MEGHQDALVGGALVLVQHVPVVAQRGGAEEVGRDAGAAGTPPERGEAQLGAPADVVAVALDPA